MDKHGDDCSWCDRSWYLASTATSAQEAEVVALWAQTTESDWLTLRLNERQVRDFVIAASSLPRYRLAGPINFRSANRSAKDWAIRKSKLPAETEFGRSG